MAVKSYVEEETSFQRFKVNQGQHLLHGVFKQNENTHKAFNKINTLQGDSVKETADHSSTRPEQAQPDLCTPNQTPASPSRLQPDEQGHAWTHQA